MSTAERPASTAERPASTAERPASTAERPASTAEPVASTARRRAALALALLLTTTAACGKKGPPLPPLVRVPQAASPATVRMGDEVFVTFTIATQNVDGLSPADISRVDLVAVTADRQPERDEFERLAVKVASVPVAPPPRIGEDGKPIEAPPAVGVAQGDTVTLKEVLTAEIATPVVLPRKPPPPPPTPAPPPKKGAGDVPPVDPGSDPPADDAARAAAPEAAPESVPDVAPAGPRRYYQAIGIGARGRESRSFAVSVPVSTLPPPPERPTITYTRDELTLSWRAAPDAAGYNVYRAAPEAGPAEVAKAAPLSTPAPQPLNAAEQTSTSFVEPVAFGTERCYQVRATTMVDGESIQGAPSTAVCETAVDTFPPAAPTGLRALAADVGIDLVWQPNTDADLGGYAILRGTAGDATLLQIAQTPATQTRFVDRTVTAGTRYVYAVVAFDTHTPPNRSDESARDDELAP